MGGHLIIGVVSDTHVPDRARRLHPGVVPLFREAGVAAILHAGDVSVRRVLDELETIAPVYAVRGNRDWIALRELPDALQLTFDGVTVGLTHGHGRWWNYAMNRVEYMVSGYRLGMFLPRLLETFPAAQVIVFGHVHRALNYRVGDQLVFNPGSPHFPDGEALSPSVGLLHIENGAVSAEIVPLAG